MSLHWVWIPCLGNVRKTAGFSNAHTRTADARCVGFPSLRDEWTVRPGAGLCEPLQAYRV